MAVGVFLCKVPDHPNLVPFPRLVVAVRRLILLSYAGTGSHHFFLSFWGSQSSPSLFFFSHETLTG